MLDRGTTRLAFMLVVGAIAVAGCIGTPDGIEPVDDFDAQRYLGTWYEIARLDHRFERDLSRVTARYSRRDDGAVRVINRGFDGEEGQWSEIEGVARFVDSEDQGHLKVSFFGPFYASYVVFGLDRENYDYAFVSGFNRDYLWLLAREPFVDQGLRERFVARARELGFDTSELIWVDQSPIAGSE